jgi:RimJ/RimL family protein N-acetyltransferase
MPDQLEIKSYQQWEDVESFLKVALEQEKRHIFWDVQYWLSKGARLWLGMIEGELAIVSFNRDPTQEGAFFFPLTTNCGLIWNAVTLPKFRGRGLYPAMLRFISSSLFSEGVESIFISCFDYNIASIKGIKKAGFRKIGTGIVRKRTGKGLWMPFAKPCRLN